MAGEEIKKRSYRCTGAAYAAAERAQFTITAALAGSLSELSRRGSFLMSILSRLAELRRGSRNLALDSGTTEASIVSS